MVNNRSYHKSSMWSTCCDIYCPLPGMHSSSQRPGLHSSNTALHKQNEIHPNLLCLSNNQQCYSNSDTESVLDAICYFTGFISSECCILVMCDTDCHPATCHSIWAYISRVQVRGATALQRCTQNPKIENVHLFTKPLCQSALRRQFKISFILHPLAIACANFGATPNFAPKNVSPNFQNS